MNDSSPAPSSTSVRLTEEQRAAVETAGREVYVTAAAGSGKTAVLTERVFRLITESGPEGDPPVELERLLVITFTRKAAQEMRERIEKRIHQGLEHRPDSAALRGALDALPRSNIMTIDAFCDRMVRRHFHQAGISPAARLADEEEEREIVHAATREVFEASASGDHGLGTDVFANLLRSTPPSRSGLLDALERRVHRLRSYVASLEDGDAWMRNARTLLEGRRSAESLAVLPDLIDIQAGLRRSTAEVAELLEAVWAAAVQEVGDPESIPVGSAWKSSIDLLRRFSNESTASKGSGFLEEWREFREELMTGEATQALLKLHLKSSCGSGLYPSPMKNLLKKTSDDFARWRDENFSQSEDQLLHAERLAASQVLSLLELAEAVEARVQDVKRRRSLLGFGDIQRKALNLLTENGGPSDIAVQYRDFFEHVLVDEYQDVSPLQDALIRRIARSPDPASGVRGNLFIVGDVKQSIYRFRQAEPILFRSRLDRGAEPDSSRDPLTLNLTRNFRSRPGVLEAVNRIFEGLMDRPIGDVEMKEDALLQPGRAEDPPGVEPAVEIQWLDLSELDQVNEPSADAEAGYNGDGEGEGAGDADLRSLEIEARWIAARIRELERAGESAWIPDETVPGGHRPIRPSDCAILVRSLSTSVDAWIAELSRWNLNVRTAGGESLWQSVEGQDLLAALRLVDQPLDDLALATFLRSPMAGFTDNDLLRLRIAGGRGPFHEAVWRTAGRMPPGELTVEDAGSDAKLDSECLEKLDRFFERLDRWRQLAVNSPAETVLDHILNETAYEAHVMGTTRAESGLRHLEELRYQMRARERQSSHAAALSDFLRSLDAESGGGRDQEDESLRDDPDAVHLMTIHKSKGLEFPVVFVARMAQRYNLDPRSTSLLFDRGGSIAMAGVDSARKVRLEPPSLSNLYQREARALRGEELRLLYVAMTRARERLILVACGKGIRNHREPGGSLIELGAQAPAHARVRAGSPAALIGPRLFALEREAAPLPWLHVHEAHTVVQPPTGEALRDFRDALLRTDDDAPSAWNAALDAWARKNGRDLPSRQPRSASPRLASPALQDSFTRTPLKIRPSQLTDKADEAAGQRGLQEEKFSESVLFDEAEMLPVRREHPEEASTSSPSGRQFSVRRNAKTLGAMESGRLVHAFMQHLDLRASLDEDGLRAEARRLFDKGLLDIESPESLELIPFRGIATFFETALGGKLTSRPNSVTRELPFTRWLQVQDIRDRTPELEGADPERLLTVQGVIDCVVDEGDHVTLIDYKNVAARGESDLDRLKSTYASQLNHYAEALQSAWQLPHAPNSYLVLLQTGQIVPMPS